jgi:hypothetical protein
MKLATIALAVAFALPTTFAIAEGSLNYSTPAARPVVRRHAHTPCGNQTSEHLREYSCADHA